MGFYLTEQATNTTTGSTVASHFRLVAKNRIGAPFWHTILSTKYWDGDSKLLYYGYRYDSPGMGRWLSRDPIGENGNGNLFAFVKNRPTTLRDPFGLTNDPGDFGWSPYQAQIYCPIPPDWTGSWALGWQGGWYEARTLSFPILNSIGNYHAGNWYQNRFPRTWATQQRRFQEGIDQTVNTVCKQREIGLGDLPQGVFINGYGTGEDPTPENAITERAFGDRPQDAMYEAVFQLGRYNIELDSFEVRYSDCAGCSEHGYRWKARMSVLDRLGANRENLRGMSPISQNVIMYLLPLKRAIVGSWLLEGQGVCKF